MAGFVNFDKDSVSWISKCTSTNDRRDVAIFVMQQYKQLHTDQINAKKDAQNNANKNSEFKGEKNKRQAALDRLKAAMK